jgi:glycosyltransferase involved in cell wall biosynthesis
LFWPPQERNRLVYLHPTLATQAPHRQTVGVVGCCCCGLVIDWSKSDFAGFFGGVQWKSALAGGPQETRLENKMPCATRIICLSNVYDQNYHDVRGEAVSRILSVAKRVGLFQCLKTASSAEVIIVSVPPKALERRSPRWLPTVETRFSTFPQIFCCNWDVPKLRVPLSWIFYAWQVMRRTRTGDILLIDNYEFVYVAAAWFSRLFRRVTFILDYEDGKHLIDRSWSRVLSGVAEWLGRRLLHGAILVHPGMKDRLPAGLPTVLVPGFVAGTGRRLDLAPSGEIRFLYSGTLDGTRGVDLLLEALKHLPDSGWHLDITGSGPLAAEVERVVSTPGLAGKVSFHRTLPGAGYEQLVAAVQVGLNCQRVSDPISEVTFPSKVFTYLSANLVVLSSPAGAVRQICGPACVYYEGETAESLAAAMRELIDDFPSTRERLKGEEVRERYSPAGTAARLREFLETISLSR